MVLTTARRWRFVQSASLRAVYVVSLGIAVSLFMALTLPTAASAETTTVTIGVGETTTRVAGSASPGALVTFLVDGAVAGSVTADTNGDYVQVLTDQTPGVHTYSVYAQDAAGQLTDTVSLQASVTEHMQTQVEVFLPPTVHLSDNEVAQGEPIVAAGATAAGAQVVVYVDGSYASVSADGAGLWQYTIATGTMSSGEHQLYVVAAKQTGQQSRTSQVRTFIVVPKPVTGNSGGASSGAPAGSATVPVPKVPTIESPKSGTTTNTNEIALYGTAEPGVQIEVWNRGRLIGSVFAGKDGRWRMNVPLTEFENELKVRACRYDVCSVFSPSVRVYFSRPPTLAEMLGISLNRYRHRIAVGKPVVIRTSVTGGSRPYILRIDWGDGTKEVVDLPQSPALLRHMYRRAGSFNGTVVATDKDGQHSSVSFSVLAQAPTAKIPAWVKIIILAVLLALLVLLLARRRKHEHKPA